MTEKQEAPDHTPIRIAPLKSIKDVRSEMARCYRDARRGHIKTQDLTRYCYALTCLQKAIEAEVLELRLDKLEAGRED